MSKELEALKRITNSISVYKLHGIGDKNWLGIQDVLKDIDTLEEALTPPTEQEVCDALSEYLGEEVIYSNDNFCFKNSMLAIVSYGYESNNFYVIIHDNIGLNPHLITMIGRFYESEVRK